MNLMPQKYKLDHYLKYATTISAVIFIGVASFYPYLTYRTDFLKKEVEKMQSGKMLYEELSAEVAEKYDLLDALKLEFEELENSKNKTDVYYEEDISFSYKEADFNLPDMLLDFAFEIPEDIKIYTIRSVGTTGVIIRAVAEKQESVGAFVLNLESKTWIHDMSLRKIEQRIRTSGYKYYAFEIEILTDGTKSLKDLEQEPNQVIDNEASVDEDSSEAVDEDSLDEENSEEDSEEEIIGEVEVNEDQESENIN